MDKTTTNEPPPYSTFPQPTQQNYIAPPPPIGLNVEFPLQQINYGPEPQHVLCPSCHALIYTHTRTEPTTKTHMSALIMFCCLCWPCAWLPYCMDSCQNINHYCPNCTAYLGSYQN